MRVGVVGGGPGGLYAAILLKGADPSRDVRVMERNRAEDTFGFGVVFSDATLAEIEAADPETYRSIAEHFVRWGDIDVHYRGERLTSTGHGFAGMSRHRLLSVLQERARTLGVEVAFEREMADAPALAAEHDLVVGADGVNSTVRAAWEERFAPEVDLRPNRFVWLGTTRPFPAFTFDFVEDAHGLWRVHAYQYAEVGGEARSTFIVETTEATWRAAGLAEDDEEATRAFCERLFAERLDGHPLVTNRSLWRRFPTVRCGRWAADNVVLLGDAAHTAHFSVGSGTRMAMVDAIALAAAVDRSPDDVAGALEAYEAERRPAVESLQRAARASLDWFEGTERYMDLEPIQFTFALLTRSLRITHDELRVRDPAFVARVDAWFARGAAEGSGRAVSLSPPPPPMFTPLKLRGMVLENRVVVSPMCQYCAADGTPDDWHLVHLGSRAIGGAGLVMAEMTDVSRDARISTGCAGLYSDAHVAAWKRVVAFIHGASAAKVGIQLGHAGRKGATRLMWEGGEKEPLDDAEAWDLLSASALPYLAERSRTPREMAREDMDAAVADYAAAAERALEAGFDLLEVHMAHGYLLASFISPLTNERGDAYGGTLENRMRFPLEVFDACRAVWPDERPMSVRISAVDWSPDGMEPGDAVEVARLLKGRGCDIVDVSAGQTVPDQRPRYGRLFQTPFADRIRNEVGLPTMAVGNISSWMDVNTILAAGRADLCMLARAHLFDPYWTRHAAWQQGFDLAWPPQYASVARYTPRFEFRFTGEE